MSARSAIELFPDLRFSVPTTLCSRRLHHVVESHPAQFGGDERGCPALLETEFGVTMKVAAPSRNLLDELW